MHFAGDSYMNWYFLNKTEIIRQYINSLKIII